MPPANEEDADFELPSSGSAEVVMELLVVLRPAIKSEDFLELLAVRANWLGDGVAAREGELLMLECMPSKGGGERDEEEATRVLPPPQKQCDAIFECRVRRYASKSIQRGRQ